MADVRVASTGDAVPLLDPDGSSNYVVGRNNQADIRASLMTLLGSANGSSFAVRPGVYARSYSAGTVGSLRVIQNGTADRNVQVQGGISLHTRGGTSPYLAYWPATTLIQASPADPTNPRVDLVVARVYDKAAFPADPFHGPYIEIIEGTAAASPSAPALPDGAIPLAELARDAGAPGDTITTAKITDKRKVAHLPGTPRLLMAGDLAADAGSVPGEQRYRVVAGALLPMEYWGADSQWHGTVPIPLTQPAQTASGVLVPGASVRVAQLAIADPGYPYKLRASAGLLVTTATSVTHELVMQINLTDSFLAVGAGNVPNANTVAWGSLSMPTGGQNQGQIMPRTSGVLTGAKNLYYWVKHNAGASDMTIFAGFSYSFQVDLIPT